MTPLLKTRLSVDYPNKPDVLHNVELEIGEGEILGLVGESGSGKSTIALALLRLLDHKGGSIRGEILFNGWDLLRLRAADMRRIRGREIALPPPGSTTGVARRLYGLSETEQPPRNSATNSAERARSRRPKRRARNGVRIGFLEDIILSTGTRTHRSQAYHGGPQT